MRSFIAVNMKKDELKPVLEELEDIRGLKVVPFENLHLTLKFLGDISEEKAEDVVKAIKNSVESREAFKISLKGVGTFPSPKKPRVIWAGIEEGKENLKIIQKKLEDELEGLGFKKEKRKWEPHLTLARVKKPEEKKKIIEFLEKYSDKDFGKLTINNIELKKSRLTPSGPIYTTVKNLEF